MWLPWHAAMVLCFVITVLATWLRGFDSRPAVVAYGFARETAIIGGRN